jgi:hypothetical protein
MGREPFVNAGCGGVIGPYSSLAWYSINAPPKMCNHGLPPQRSEYELEDNMISSDPWSPHFARPRKVFERDPSKL